tara:strand:- start:312 stop:797 length:486 start_codon:yes stop_codon:yes gene_type:complete
MTKVSKKALGWALVVSLIIWGILMGTDNTVEQTETVTNDIVEDTATETWPYPTEEEVRFVHPPEKKEVEEVVTPPIVEEILHFTDDGILIAPYPDYDNFQDAFAFARGMLGDSSSHDGELRIFLWRGNRYHTETIEQSALKDSVEEEIVEPDTTVKDSTNN